MCATDFFFGDEKTETCCIPKKNNPCMVYLSTFAIKKKPNVGNYTLHE